MPQHKKDQMMPIVNEVFENAWSIINAKEIQQTEAKKDINRLRQQKEARDVRINQLSTVISLKE